MENSRSVSYHRPLGVTIIVALFSLQCLGNIILTFVADVNMNTVLQGQATATHPLTAAQLALLSSAMTMMTRGGGIIGGIIALFFIYKFWTLHRWAYWIILVVEGLILLGGIPPLTNHTVTIFSMFYNIIVPAVLIVYCLTNASIRSAFRH